MPATVGVIADPASGRDIRRLVAGASVFDNAEKGSMVFRAMAGLGEAGVERVLMMPAADGVGAALERQLSGRCGALAEAPFPVLEVLGQASTGTAHDTVAAVREMVARDVAAIVVLGGDGTHRLVAAHCGDIPLLALSTGTNNAFPEMREATVAGLAAGLVATGAAPADGTVVREHGLEVSTNGRRELALVDVAVSTERFVGARALWKAGSVSELFVAFAGPSAIGLSAIAGILDPVARGERGGTARPARPAGRGGAHRARPARPRADRARRASATTAGSRPGRPSRCPPRRAAWRSTASARSSARRPTRRPSGSSRDRAASTSTRSCA